ncbi:MAG: D-alanyl-D-alanine carboxypeptidase/D-alanyl-D-alanine-endopeptidase, partial [Candidatus Eisenbacteria bacterium]|nr:D-alanyl-D-alanine carboxypeptidase/D-alanyl-D-alanine-endopeptidase [Candidatus Eisenbacteria bacterium]
SEGARHAADSAAAAHEEERPDVLSGLDRLIASRLDDLGPGTADVSVSVHTPDGRVLYERAADRPMAPASNMKIVTAACALSLLGHDHRFVTDIMATGQIESGALDGDLYVVGGGDPSIVSEELWKICEALRARGLREIRGDLVLDTSFFDGEARAVSGGDDGDRAYHARTGALSLNFNTVAVHVYPGKSRGDAAVVSVTPDLGIVELRGVATTGSSRRGTTIDVRRRFENGRNVVAVTGRIAEGSAGRTWYRNLDDPAGCFGEALVSSLAMFGVSLDGTVREGRCPREASLLHRHESKPLSLVVRDLGKYSNNFVAEQLLKALCAEVDGPPGSTGCGSRMLSDYLVSLGLEPASFRVVDGSGFSKDNRLTTRAIASVIAAALADFETSCEFATSLSVGGVDGTLSDRMEFPGLRGQVRAKTGLLRGVTAISGLLHTLAGDDVIFSVITEAGSCEAWRLHDLEHEILAYVARETPPLGGWTD